jgi:methyl-accepting chemotaxis protein
LKIGTKLLLAFSAMTLAVVAVGVTGVGGLAQAKALSEGPYQASTKALGLLVPMGQDLVKMRVITQTALLGGADLAASKKELAEVRYDFDSSLRAYSDTQTDEAGQAQHQALQDKYAPYKALLDRVLFIAENGNLADAIKLLRESGTPVYTTLEDQMTQFATFNTERVTATLGAGAESADQAMTLALALTVLAFLGSLVLAWGLARSLSRPLQSATALAGRLADGDLTVRFDARLVRRTDEVGVLARALDGLAASLFLHISTIQAAGQSIEASAQSLEGRAGALAQVAGQIRTAADEGNGRAAQQTQGVEETAAAVQQILRTIEDLDGQVADLSAGMVQSSAALKDMAANTATIAQATGRLSTVFTELQTTSDVGAGRIREMIEKIRAIAAESDHLEEANEAIRGIASQTSLLSMNAAIEAAHAGDAGRGFSVVADEIGKLSQSAASQSRQIAQEIESIRGLILAVSQSSTGAEEAFVDILSPIQTLGTVQRDVKSAVDRHETGTAQVVTVSSRVADVAAHVREGSAQMVEASRNVSEEIGRILVWAQELQKGNAVIVDETNEVAAAVEAIRSDAAANRALSSDLDRIVGVFRV